MYKTTSPHLLSPCPGAPTPSENVSPSGWPPQTDVIGPGVLPIFIFFFSLPSSSSPFFQNTKMVYVRRLCKRDVFLIILGEKYTGYRPAILVSSVQYAPPDVCTKSNGGFISSSTVNTTVALRKSVVCIGHEQNGEREGEIRQSRKLFHFCSISLRIDLVRIFASQIFYWNILRAFFFF